MKSSSSNTYDASVTSAELLEVKSTEGFCERRLKVPENLGYLEGHFPNFPVVPAVVQIQWVMDVAQELLGEGAVLERIEALKFKEPLRPGQVFRLRVELSAARDVFAFRLWEESHLFSSGRCVLGRTKGTMDEPLRPHPYLQS